MNHVSTGKYTGHSAALTLCLGFIPSAMFIYNITTDPSTGVWCKDDGAGNGLSIDGAGIATATTTTGFTEYAGGDIVSSATDAYQDGKGNQIAAGARTSQGVTIGTDSDLNTDNEVFCFFAIGAEASARTLTTATTGYDAIYVADEGTD